MAAGLADSRLARTASSRTPDNLLRAIKQVTAKTGTPSTVSHLVYSHFHADHIGASWIFGDDVVRVGHVDNRRLLGEAGDPNRPAPTLTFKERHVLPRRGRAASRRPDRRQVPRPAGRRRRVHRRQRLRAVPVTAHRHRHTGPIRNQAIGQPADAHRHCVDDPAPEAVTVAAALPMSRSEAVRRR